MSMSPLTDPADEGMTYGTFGVEVVAGYLCGVAGSDAGAVIEGDVLGQGFASKSIVKAMLLLLSSADASWMVSWVAGVVVGDGAGEVYGGGCGVSVAAAGVVIPTYGDRLAALCGRVVGDGDVQACLGVPCGYGYTGFASREEVFVVRALRCCSANV